MKKYTTTEDYWIAETATVVGNVELGKDVSVWYGAVLRGDFDKISVGARTNIQDGAILHEETTVGENCTIGHGAIVHGCIVGNNTLIGMGAIVLSGAVIGNNCMVGAGALVTGNTVVPDNTLIMGSPAKIMKPMTPELLKSNQTSVDHYLEAVENLRKEGTLE